MESIPCIFGHGYSDDVVIEENGFQGRRCPGCGLIFISPRPDPREVLELYHQDEAHLSAEHHHGYNPSADLDARTHFHAIYNSNSVSRKPLSILEIGCGDGRFLQVARENGHAVFGVELNPHQARHVQEKLGIPCETTPFSPHSFADKKFDIIFHSDVTNHLSDPIEDFTVMREKLNPHGQLVFETGNGADIHPRYYKYIPGWKFPDQRFLFGEASLRELLQRAGFNRSHFVSWSILPQLALIRALRRNKTRTPGSRPTSGTSQAEQTHLLKKRRLLQLASAHTMHFARFTLGSFSSDPQVPRTMLVWAMK
jgi:SAM-dependent methyltransferase